MYSVRMGRENLGTPHSEEYIRINTPKKRPHKKLSKSISMPALYASIQKCTRTFNKSDIAPMTSCSDIPDSLLNSLCRLSTVSSLSACHGNLKKKTLKSITNHHDELTRKAAKPTCNCMSPFHDKLIIFN